jgi:hypothetical protein
MDLFAQRHHQEDACNYNDRTEHEGLDILAYTQSYIFHKTHNPLSFPDIFFLID